jgi:hypothetical protein
MGVRRIRRAHAGRHRTPVEADRLNSAHHKDQATRVSPRPQIHRVTPRGRSL